MDHEHHVAHEGHVMRARKGVWGFVLWAGDRLVDWLEERLRILIIEKDLFLGTLFFILGFLNFHSGKYCDGNSADYLSCTRPVTYYYYTWWEIALVILGVFLILIWFVQRNRRH